MLWEDTTASVMLKAFFIFENTCEFSGSKPTKRSIFYFHKVFVADFFGLILNFNFAPKLAFPISINK